jgi:hypothetical protein
MRLITILSMIMLMSTPAWGAIIANHTAVAAFDLIPAEQFDEIRANYSFFYGHTSHGSQIMTGLDMLVDEDPALYIRPPFHEISDDLGHNGDTSWVQPTRDWLTGHPECNVVMWSWCGGCSDNSEAGINTYLAAMEGLEAEYPDVVFIYMTGHLDGSGVDGNLYARNNQIRDYCLAHDKVLFDFADIESWDPDGNYYPDESDACNWCYDWCAEFTCPGCGSCAHSHCFNCYLKGKGFWWMMAGVNGWGSSAVDGTPATATVRLEQNHPNPFNPSTEISFQITKSGQVSLEIFRITGQRVATLHQGTLEKGGHSFHWDGRDESGADLGSGVYLYRLRTEEREETRKMTLVK